MGSIGSLTVRPQMWSRWCWAAVAEGVARCYSAATTWTQCRIANAELGRNLCCILLLHLPCNRSGRLGSALRHVGHLRQLPQVGPATFQNIRDEVDALQPLGAAIAWRGGGTHFIAIKGYDVDGQNIEWVELEDPHSLVGNSRVRYSELQASYQGRGSWSHTYTTSAAGQTTGAAGVVGRGQAEPLAP